jgi:ABC-2 type transport system ATP-binding protein
MEAIQITHLSKNYGNISAIDDITLSIKKQEIIGLLGPNGAGKTTLLMILSTLLKPSSGEAIVNGYNVTTQASQVRSSIGMVFQDPSSDELLTGYENLKLHALMYNIPMNSINKKIDSVLALVDLQKRKNDIVKTYSGGMRRRLEIARGLLHEPQILFLDEPTLGLDPQTREHIWEYIKSLAKQNNMTIVLTTHYMEEAENLCNRIAIIDEGKIIAYDTPENLIHSIGGDRVRLEGLNLDERALKRLPFVEKVEKIETGIILYVENAGGNLKEILNTAGKVSYADVHTPDLNDVFLRYTGRNIRESFGSEIERLRVLNAAKIVHR